MKQTTIFKVLALSFMLVNCGSTNNSTGNSADNTINTNEINENNDIKKVRKLNVMQDFINRNKPQIPFDAPTFSRATISEYLEMVNRARASEQDCGEYGIKPAVSALKWDHSLYNAAYEHAYDMRNAKEVLSASDVLPKRVFSRKNGVIVYWSWHIGSGSDTDWTDYTWELGGAGSTVIQRMYNNGVTYTTEWGEVAAVGFKTAQDTIDWWLQSDGHCNILMTDLYTHMGYSKYEKAYTIDFSRK
ncbi:MAG: CAP domain-containing protein [Sulfurovum sp.]|nr:CAP domain-containing protein [Sulfurovum sp.]